MQHHNDLYIMSTSPNSLTTYSTQTRMQHRVKDYVCHLQAICECDLRVGQDNLGINVM